MKQNQTNTTATNETKNHLQELQAKRNALVNLATQDRYYMAQFEKVNTELIQTISEIATYKTLKFLLANNATHGTTTEQTENGTTNTQGYNIALKLFNSAYSDIAIMHNPELITDILTDTADLIQTANATLTPYFNSLIAFSLEDTIYTKVLKNGNIKNYTAFSLACKSIREYITAQDKKHYKKLAYCIGFTDNGTEVLTTKRPKNDITDIEEKQKIAFISQYGLTTAEQDALLDKLNGLDTTATAEKMQVSKRTVERLLKSAKEKIATVDKRIKI